MWSLEVINFRNQAHAAGLTAYEVNFLSENKIFPIVGYKITEASIQNIQTFKDQNGESNHGRPEA